MSDQQPQQPQFPPLFPEPATVEACAADYDTRDTTGEAATQRGEVYAAAQTGIPRTTGGN